MNKLISTGAAILAMLLSLVILPDRVAAQDCVDDCIQSVWCSFCYRGVGPPPGSNHVACSCTGSCEADQCDSEEEQQEEQLALTEVVEGLEGQTGAALRAVVAVHRDRLLLNQAQRSVVVLSGCKTWVAKAITSVGAEQFELLSTLDVPTYEQFLADGGVATPKRLADLDSN